MSGDGVERESVIIKRKETKQNALTQMICGKIGFCHTFNRAGSEALKKVFNGYTDFGNDFVKNLTDPFKYGKKKELIYNENGFEITKETFKGGANGRVDKIIYNKSKFKSVAVLKSIYGNGKKDNLFYEYQVGKFFLNDLKKCFPCFCETYALFFNDGKKNVLMKDDILLEGQCKNYSILTEYVEGGETLNDLLENETMVEDKMYCFFQVYFALAVLRKNFTHHDLHTENVVVYQPDDKRYIQYNYVFSDRTISFKSRYCVKIIDYGRCSFDNKELFAYETSLDNTPHPKYNPSYNPSNIEITPINSKDLINEINNFDINLGCSLTDRDINNDDIHYLFNYYYGRGVDVYSACQYLANLITESIDTNNIMYSDINTEIGELTVYSDGRELDFSLTNSFAFTKKEKITLNDQDQSIRVYINQNIRVYITLYYSLNYKRKELLEKIEKGNYEQQEFIKKTLGELSNLGPIRNWDVGQVTVMSNLFLNYDKFNEELHWDVSKVEDMFGMFYNCTQFDKPLKNRDGTQGWDVEKVKNMSYMFQGCSSFNQPLTLKLRDVTDMSFMFYDCSSFNQPLTLNNIENVKDMSYMFHGCSSFNQPLTLKLRDVTNMTYMFGGCSSFNQPLTLNVEKVVTKMDYMFQGCSSFIQPLTLFVHPDFLKNKKNYYKMFNDCPNKNITFIVKDNVPEQTKQTIQIDGVDIILITIPNKPPQKPARVTRKSYNPNNLPQKPPPYNTSSTRKTNQQPQPLNQQPQPFIKDRIKNSFLSAYNRGLEIYDKSINKVKNKYFTRKAPVIDLGSPNENDNFNNRRTDTLGGNTRKKHQRQKKQKRHRKKTTRRKHNC